MEEIPSERLSEYRQRYIKLHAKYQKTLTEVYKQATFSSGRFAHTRVQRDRAERVKWFRDIGYADELRKDLDNFIGDIPYNVREIEPIASLLYRVIEFIETVR